MARLSDKLRNHAEGKPPVNPAFEPLATRDTLTDLPLEQISADPSQPRKALGNLTDLESSIRALGVVQPIIVRPIAYNAYEIIAGERRYTAAKAAGLARVPAIVRTVEEHQKLELQIVENLHRKDLNPLEEAEGYRRLMHEFGLTQEVLGQRVGKSQASVNETLRLLELPEPIRADYQSTAGAGEAPRVSKSLLLEIVKQPTEAQKRTLWESAKRGELTVKAARARKPTRPGDKGGRRGAGPGKATTGEAAMPFRYPIATADATVTVQFARSKATPEDIVAALEEALHGERARLDRG